MSRSSSIWPGLACSRQVRQLIGATRAAATGDPDKFSATNRSVNL